MDLQNQPKKKKKIYKIKVRIEAQGFQQIKEIDYFDTFVSIMR